MSTPVGALDATHTPFSLSLLTSTKYNASKKLIADHAGRPVSDPAHKLGITTGAIEHIQLAGLADLRDLLQGVTTRQALVHGTRKGSLPGERSELVTLAALARHTQNGTPRPPGMVTRSLQDLDYPEGRRLLMLDVDPYPEVVTPQSALELIQQLADLWPVFAEVGWLATVSTRSAIKDKQTHAWLTPPAGFHVYVLVTGDVARFRELARVHLWLAGTGYCKLASPHAHTGVAAVLERCVIDLRVFSPERLDYVAGAIIEKNAPFYQDRPLPELHAGAVLDLDALPDVTDEERQQYAALVQAARLRVQPEREATVRAHIQHTSPALDAAAVTLEVTARLERTDYGVLTSDHPLVFDQRRTPVTAGTVTAALDGKRLADPFEPDYRDGADAIFHWNKGHWLINSFAHGVVKTYRLEPTAPEPDADEPWPEAPQPHAHKKGDHSTIAAILALRFRDTLAFDTGRKAWMQYGAGTPGIWGELSEEAASNTVRTAMESLVAGSFRGGDLASVESLLRTHLYRSLSTGQTGWLPFPNGALELASMICHTHTPERAFTWCLPYAYDAEALCPKAQRWLHQATGNAHDQVQVLRAFCKAVVAGHVELQRYLELLGPGGTGKSTFIRLLEGLVGPDNVCTTELKYLELNRFEQSHVVGKRLIAITDAERYGGSVTALKAITGQDTLRLERKYKAQSSGVAEGLVIVSANEPIQSADYTSGLERRRLTLYFRHRPTRPRDLISIKGAVFQGELVPELAGVLNWALALPDTLMEALLRETTAHVPSLKETWTHSLVETNPLADWANRAVIHDQGTDTTGKPIAVNVGVAKKVDRSNDYEHEETWLYPNYRRYTDDTGGKPLSSRRFTNLLTDLCENQLRLDGVWHTDDRNGSRFVGLRLRTYSDSNVELLVMKAKPTPVTDVTGTVTDQTHASDGCDACDAFLQTLACIEVIQSTQEQEQEREGERDAICKTVFLKNSSLASQPPSTLRNASQYPSHPSHGVTVRSPGGAQCDSIN